MTATPASLRAGVVGAGLMGRWHAHAIGRIGGRVVAVVDPDVQRAQRLAARLPERPPVASDLDQAIRERGIEVVHVCTPLSTHDAIVRVAIEAGIPVLVEKPLAPDAASAEALHTLASARGVLLCPVHQFLFQPGILAAERATATLGAVRQLDVVACSAGADGASDPEREAVALDILPHGLALVRRLLSSSMADLEWRVGQGPPGEIRVMADVAGVSVMLAVSMRARPTENSLILRCDGGTVRANLFHGYATIERGAASRIDKVGRPFVGSAQALSAAIGNLVGRAVRREPAYPGLRELVRRFHLACARQGPSPISVEESLDVTRARDSIRQSRSRRDA
ncbi:MAG: Gfo/Idh/MocA family protein [Gemmatimonadaceae bacterium]